MSPPPFPAIPSLVPQVFILNKKTKKMADILEEIVAHKRIEIEQRKRFIQPRQMITLTEQKMQEDGGKVPGGSMKESLMNSETGIIAEFKRKSPSKGWIKQKVSRASSRSPTSRTEPRRSASSPTLITSEDMMSIFRRRAMWALPYLSYIRTSW